MIRGPVSTLSLEGAETLSGLPEIPTAVRHREPWEGLPAVLEWALVAYAGSTLGRVFPLPLGETLLGRSPDCGLALPDGEVSRRHACLHVTPGGVRLEDLGSTNGTRLNGIPLHGSATLLAGDRVTVGGHVLKLVAMDPLERAFHETLLDLSTRDPLTGLANRSCVLAELQNRFGLSLRYGRPLSVVICDLDHFKRVNDAHGHAAGDQVLRAFGAWATASLREADLAGRIGGEEFLMVLPETDLAGDQVLRAFGAWATASLREADLAGRIGGEEFLMVLPETDLAGAQPFAERLRQVVASRPVPVSSGGLGVTCSLGIAQRRPDDLDAGQLLARADAALYRAKAEGRDRVCSD